MTLTQVATFTRRTIIISMVLSILGLSSFIGYRIWYTNYLANLPPVVEKPDTKFGVLPSPEFSPGIASGANFSYSIDTTTGNLPKFDPVIRVYFLPKGNTSLLAGQKGDELAQKLKLPPTPKILSDTKYSYSSSDSNLIFDLETGNFTYIKEATIAAKLAENEPLEDDDRLIANFKTLLNQLGVLREDLAQGQSKLQKVFLAEKEAAVISLWPKDLDTKPIITGDFNKGLVSTEIFKSSRQIENYTSLSFIYWPIDKDIFATYPSKTAEQALENLKIGKGIIALAPNKPQISITSVYLAFYQSLSYSPYMQPIYVFEGPQFAAFVPAIADQYLSTAR